MRGSVLAALGSSILLVVAGCQAHDPAAPGSDNQGARPSFDASLTCRYQPSGTVEIPVGSQKFFTQSAGDCTGAYGVLSPTNGQLGFNKPAPCTVFEKTAANTANRALVVLRCTVGTGTLKVYTNSSKT